MHRQRTTQHGFTIVELLIAATITVLIVVMLGTMFGSLSSTASRANQRTDTFRDARAALQMMSRDLTNVVHPQWEPDPFSVPPPTGPSQPLTRPAAHLALKNIYQDPAAGNQQVYALIAAKNSGTGDLCSVGYYCRWNDQGYGYSLRRFFRPSSDTTSTPPVTGTYTTLSSTASYVSETILYTPDAVGTLAKDMHDDLLAQHVWNLKVTAYDASGAVITTYPYVCDSSSTSATQLPKAIEISFWAMSPEAARTVIAVKADANTWMNESDPTYQRLIKPHAHEFRTRIEL